MVKKAPKYSKKINITNKEIRRGEYLVTKPSREIFVNYYGMKKQLLYEQERIEGLKEFRKSLLSEMPDSELIPTINADIEELKENAAKLETILNKEKNLVKSKLNLINDITARVAASLHYIDGLSWEDVSQIMKLNGADPTRERVYRSFTRSGL